MASIVFSAAATTPVPAGHKSGHVRRRVIHDRVWNRNFFWNCRPFWFLNEESLKWEIQMKAKAQTTHHAKRLVPVGQKKNFRNHLSGFVVDLMGVHFLPISQSNIQPFLRAGDTQAKWSAKYGPNGLCVLTAISEKGGCFICLWVKNEPLVGPKQCQIGGIKSSFFLPDWHFQLCVIGYSLAVFWGFFI